MNSLSTPHADGKTPAEGSAGRHIKRLLHSNEIVLVLVVFAAIASFASPIFLSQTNLQNLLSQSSILGILACGQFLVVLVGGFDLSVAAILALSSVIFASLAPVSLPLAAVAALASGLVLGAISGIAVTFGKVTPMIATLGVMGIARGMAFVVSEKSVSVPKALLSSFDISLWIFSLPAIVWVIVALVLAWVLARTRFGRNLYAIGGNESAARLAGLPVASREITTYALSGMLSALAGLMLVIRTYSGVPQIGNGWELDSIAAVVIGGARLFGGEGNILKAVVGVLIYQMIANVMNLVSLDPFYQSIVKAVVIVIVVSVSVMRTRRAQRGRS